MRRNPSGRGGRTVQLSVTAAVSFAIHSLILFRMVYGGSSATPTDPDQVGAGATAITAADAPVDALVLVSIQDSPTKEQAEHSVSSRGEKQLAEPIRLTSADSRPAPAPRASNASSDIQPTSNSAARAMLFGQYLGQISARVDRAWQRPHSAIDSGQFRCRVRIEQSATGEVKQVTLESCNGDPDWQMSLASAIASASPLSAPPDPSVFVSTLVMDFTSAADAYDNAGQRSDPEEPRPMAHGSGNLN